MLNKKGKIILGSLVLTIALVCVFVGGNNQQAKADEGTRYSLLELGEIMNFFGGLLGMTQPSSEEALGGTRYPNGLSADSTSPLAGEVRGATFTSTGAVTFASGSITGAFTIGGATTLDGLATVNAGLTHSYTNSTSTADTTQELSQADILDFSSVIMTPTVGATTLTFQSSSTMTDLVPVAGDWFEQTWYNASTTAGQTLIFAAGTGWDIGTSSPSATSLTIEAGETGTLRYFREPATATTFDISVDFSVSSE